MLYLFVPYLSKLYFCIYNMENVCIVSSNIGRPVNVGSMFNPTFIGKISCLVSLVFSLVFSAFRRSESIDRHRMPPVSSVMTTESYEVSLFTINRQTSYDSGILHQHYGIMRPDYGIIQGFPIGSPSG